MPHVPPSLSAPSEAGLHPLSPVRAGRPLPVAQASVLASAPSRQAGGLWVDPVGYSLRCTVRRGNCVYKRVLREQARLKRQEADLHDAAANIGAFLTKGSVSPSGMTRASRQRLFSAFSIRICNPTAVLDSDYASKSRALSEALRASAVSVPTVPESLCVRSPPFRYVIR